ncbi:MAG TPA: prolyl aminopeptidase [Candidatus Tenderia electrophaga]|uniref:Proline iminopeptidase n=1 Tax=Candidatus Tenderia electrophaga TaxID=1748243 RepID=A0A832J3V8_9GAMM|nr:prolyl aminopeptidase [Candidatus Tenderia electrophaga]
MSDLYPHLEPYVNHTIDVDPPHKLHVEECGNPSGIPVVFLHGGPGSGCEAYHRRFFNPDKYRIILFDQRGCGRSSPHAELQGNNTQALVADMELIREKLGIDKWVVFGGSWGSTLGLVYAETHPERVLGLILRGIFLCRPQEIHWFYQEGASRIFPDYWQSYLKPIPEPERHDLLHAYYRQLTSDNEIERMAAAKAWSMWEGRCATLKPSQTVVDHFADPFTALSLARIECHYFVNNSFLEEDQILHKAHKLRDIPGIIVQGRYDMVCPLESAWQLHQAWPQAELKIIDDAGHSAGEAGTRSALVDATDNMAIRLA